MERGVMDSRVRRATAGASRRVRPTRVLYQRGERGRLPRPVGPRRVGRRVRGAYIRRRVDRREPELLSGLRHPNQRFRVLGRGYSVPIRRRPWGSRWKDCGRCPCVGVCGLSVCIPFVRAVFRVDGGATRYCSFFSGALSVWDRGSCLPDIRDKRHRQSGRPDPGVSPGRRVPSRGV